MEKKKLDFFNIYSNMIVAVVAVSVSFFTFYDQKDYNEQSVRPLGYIQAIGKPGSLEVIIHNEGSGPMIIENITLSPSIEGKNLLVDRVSSQVAQYAYYTKDIKERPLSANDSFVLFALRGSPGDMGYGNALQKCHEVLRDVEVTLTYRDIYNNRQKKVVRKLDWFD